MILKASARGDGRQLGRYLLTMGGNEHIEVHQVRGFMADDVVGALSEAEAISKGTRCKQHMFSVSLNPPQSANVRTEDFERAVDAIEERNGLTGQPRVMVFHEKEGRRHCHAVWSRIDADTMTARPLPFFKNKLREVSKELYLEHGWQMPRGLMDSKERDPRNFTLAEWQKAKRDGRDAGQDKGVIQECWAVSDSRAAFVKALEERGFYLARGDRRSHVALHFDGGEPVSISRAIGKKIKDVRARLGEGDDLPSVEQARQRIGNEIAPRLKSYIEQTRLQAAKEMEPLESQRRAMSAQHTQERDRLDAGQRARVDQENRERSARLRKGMMGIWDRLSGTYAKTKRQNEMEALSGLQRDREQRHALLQAQMKDRQTLQEQIRTTRERYNQKIKDLLRDAANYRLLQKGEAPRPRDAFERLEALKAKTPQQIQPEFSRSSGAPDANSPRARLNRLKQRSPHTPPDHDLDR